LCLQYWFLKMKNMSISHTVTPHYFLHYCSVSLQITVFIIDDKTALVIIIIFCVHTLTHYYHSIIQLVACMSVYYLLWTENPVWGQTSSIYRSCICSQSYESRQAGPELFEFMLGLFGNCKCLVKQQRFCMCRP
jgi:hypothetical protein